jgi:hypothetical protein
MLLPAWKSLFVLPFGVGFEQVTARANFVGFGFRNVVAGTFPALELSRRPSLANDDDGARRLPPNILASFHFT